MPDATNLIEFQTTLRERVLRWFIKWFSLHRNPALEEVQQNFIQEFKLPQKFQQGLSELWDIKQWEGETAWECMQRFKDSIDRLSYPINPNDHRHWFIKTSLSLT